ncbi:TRAP-type mannitol/chloroaromatic compound transport system, periplasmic component [Beggiatoa alba B18LD]|uniref:TRAP-type mannitol/chloroaromatic compound transport system, periplasmic component n=1 Tax=Beggiatoa alba B18LD TaxID=395493 RepID=I3CK95_9GAMM|nr:TRAP transporter substrate-binding protein [Beggiatoa alba]EIJ44038.1 TRAP-type mannitol/chloroaromatic compound transport system, periplasmic component [Beggiatoa alba B18LD]
MSKLARWLSPVIGALAVAVTSLPSYAADTFNWKMVTTWPPNFPIFQTGVVRFAKDVETMSNGRIKIQVFAGGELVPPLQTFDAVSQGTIELGHGAAYYWAGKVPAAQFMSAVPFGMTAKGMNAWFYNGDGLKLWQEAYAPFNVVPFPGGNTGVQMGGWFNKKIESVQDLQGLKMRIPGLGGKVIAKAGGTPVLLAGGEIYTALERKTIDATEWVGPFHDERLGLYRAAQYYYYPGWHEPGTVLEVIVNKKAWDSLPPDLQKIVESAASSLNVTMYAEFEASNNKALRELKEKYKVNVLPFPPEVLKELRRLTKEVLTEESAKDPLFKKVYDSFTAFQADNDAWTTVSDDAYSEASKE